jgi:TolB protein
MSPKRGPKEHDWSTWLGALTVAVVVGSPATGAGAEPIQFGPLFGSGGSSTSTCSVGSSLPATLDAADILFDSNRCGNYEVFALSSNGTVRELTRASGYDSFWPKMSSDRRRIVFQRTPAGTHDRDYSKTSTWTMNADGTNLREIIPVGKYGWTFQAHPEWSPDGRQIAIAGGGMANVQIFITDVEGNNARRLTGVGTASPQGGVNVDPSWSSDGRSLLFVGCPPGICIEGAYEVFRMGVDGAPAQRLTNDGVRDQDPYFSPDGARIAWIRNTGGGVFGAWGIFGMNQNGSAQVPLIDDGKVNSKPDWSLDGSTIYFHRAAGALPGFNIFKINSSGGAPVALLPEGFGYENEYPDAVSLPVHAGL